MANWAQNYVVFTGEQAEINNILEEFTKMNINGYKSNTGQAFKDLEIIDDWFFDIEMEQAEDNTIKYQTKWGANPFDLIAIAKLYKTVGFKLEYEESSNELYGEYKYEKGLLYKREIDENDYPQEDEDWQPGDTEKVNLYDLLEELLEKQEFKIV